MKNQETARTADDKRSGSDRRGEKPDRRQLQRRLAQNMLGNERRPQRRTQARRANTDRRKPEIEPIAD